MSHLQFSYRVEMPCIYLYDEEELFTISLTHLSVSQQASSFISLLMTAEDGGEVSVLLCCP